MNNNLVNHEFTRHMGEIALKSMLYEVAASPKPGLVDRYNPGAHKDMDFFTFLASSSVLVSVFTECARKGIIYDRDCCQGLLESIRPVGIAGEMAMYRATKGVNTHKGLIFSLGIISAAAGNAFAKSGNERIPAEQICDLVKKITRGITHRELKHHHREELTYGERLYREYGVTGIRGEVESGFETVRSVSLPVLRKLVKNKHISINDVLVHVLLYLMISAEDSNILGRHGWDTLMYVKDAARKALDLGGMFTKDGKEYIKMMDRDFIDKNISPGGAADLLAVTLALYLLEEPDGI